MLRNNVQKGKHIPEKSSKQEFPPYSLFILAGFSGSIMSTKSYIIIKYFDLSVSAAKTSRIAKIVALPTLLRPKQAQRRSDGLILVVYVFLQKGDGDSEFFELTLLKLTEFNSNHR